VLLEAVREVEVIPPETVPAGPDFFRFADNAEFNALLTEQGFTEVEVRSIAFMHPVGSPGELWDGLLRGTVRTSATVRGQPDDVVARIRAGFDRRMQAYRAPDRPTKSRLPSSWPPGDRADYHRLNCTRAADRQLAGGFVIDSN
jgi:hypothetical protein